MLTYAMSEQQVLYETKLAKTGTMLAFGAALGMMIFVGFGLVLFSLADSFHKIFPLAWSVVCLISFSVLVRRMLRLRRNPGVYRISIDDYGLYVNCDAPSFTPSFSVIAPDIKYLVRKTIKHAESDDREYYIETKSGERYKIEELLLVQLEMKVLDLFERINDRFPWVEIVEEVKQ